jgi:hypothetical protein
VTVLFGELAKPITDFCPLYSPLLPLAPLLLCSTNSQFQIENQATNLHYNISGTRQRGAYERTSNTDTPTSEILKNAEEQGKGVLKTENERGNEDTVLTRGMIGW